MVISADAIEQEIAEFWKNIYKLERAFADVHVIKIMIQKV